MSSGGLVLLTYKTTQMTIESTNDNNSTNSAIAYSDCYVQPFFTFYNADNMAIMKQYPDKYFDLAIVDPPYGIKMSGGKVGNSKKDYKHFAGGDSCIPNAEYFAELKRISKEQIIWGGNYMFEHLEPTSCFLIWDKIQPEDFTMAMCEFAWTSMNTPAKIYKKRIVNADKDGRIHPTQKPVDLYDWILTKYSKDGFKIIDTHLGSGSIAIAIDKANTLDKKNLTFVGIELDPDYYRAAVERFKNHKRQCVLF
jgi:site-specific DNA-methyltransferase (adenine-specific)